MIGGVYYIRNRYTNRLYIGHSWNIDVRMEKHLSDLRRQTHHNKALQQDWTDFGSAAFTWGMIAPENNTRSRQTLEMDFIRIYRTDDPRLGYNIYANHR